MSPWPKGIEALEAPADYFSGVVAGHLCRPDNVLLFNRRAVKNLQGLSVRNQAHHRFVLIVNLQTVGHVSVDNQILRLEEDEALLIFPFQFHHYLDFESRKLLWLFCTFEDPDPGNLEILRFRVIRLGDRHRSLIESILTEYVREPNAVREDNRVVALTALLIEEMKTSAALPVPRGKSARAAPLKAVRLLSEINALLSSSLEQGIGVKNLADAVALSESHLRRQFREYFGVSLGKYVHEYQFHRAIALMHDSNMRFGDIASHCGFGNQASFSRAFRRRVGMAPREYASQLEAKGRRFARERAGSARSRS